MKRLLSLFFCLMLLVLDFPAFAISNDELMQMAEEYAASGDYEKAIACYELSYKSEPDKIEAYIAAGLLHLTLGEITKANSCVDSALSVDMTSSDAWVAKCRIDLAAGDIAAFESDALYAEICGDDLSDDLALRKIEGLSAENIPVKALGRKYPMNIEWITDELIIGVDDGIRLYRFE